MAEDVTFEEIMDRMLSRIEDSFDKRPSSPIYTALAPAALEIVTIYAELSDMWEEAFADTASRENLIKIALTRGISPYPATNAIVTAQAVPKTADIEPGTIFTSPDMDYAVTEKLSDGKYYLRAVEAGERGNRYQDQLIPGEYIEGLESMTITEISVYGSEEEDTESLRERYINSFEANEFGGNRNEYKNKTLKIPGVGAVKVVPAWNGGGTVKLVLQNKDFGGASPELMGTVQEFFDPNQDGMGDGAAPIGHVVTVDTAEEIQVDIRTAVTCDAGYDWEMCKPSVQAVLEKYFLSLRKGWSGRDEIVVRISGINTEILSVQGIVDVRGTTLNGLGENMVLDSFQIPVLGGVNSE